jgi:hypothetical protein
VTFVQVQRLVGTYYIRRHKIAIVDLPRMSGHQLVTEVRETPVVKGRLKTKVALFRRPGPEPSLRSAGLNDRPHPPNRVALRQRRRQGKFAEHHGAVMSSDPHEE